MSGSFNRVCMRGGLISGIVFHGKISFVNFTATLQITLQIMNKVEFDLLAKYFQHEITLLNGVQHAHKKVSINFDAE